MSTTTPPIDVAVGILYDESGRVLMAQRPPGKEYAGWWEFPGGKVEQGESIHEALARELHEEIGVSIDASGSWLIREHVYPHAHVRLHFRRAIVASEAPHAREGQQLRWTTLHAPELEPILPATVPLLRWLALPARYAISHAAELGSACFLERLDAALSAGLGVLQLREPGLAASEFDALFNDVLARCRRHNALLLVNSVHASAYWSRADGVHWRAQDLGAEGLAPVSALRWQAASCHNAEELALAADSHVDWAVLGPVHPTRSHPGAPALGWSAFSDLASQARIPVYALGGVTEADSKHAFYAGAHGLAMIRGMFES